MPVAAACFSLKADDVIPLGDTEGGSRDATPQPDDADASDAQKGRDSPQATPDGDDVGTHDRDQGPDGATGTDASGGDADADADADANEEADAPATGTDGGDAATPPPLGDTRAVAPDAASPDAPATAFDAAPEAEASSGDAASPCDPLSPFVEVAAVVGLPSSVGGGSLSPDELTIWFGAAGGLAWATRVSVSAAFGPPQMIPEFTGSDGFPTVTGDLKTLFFVDSTDSSLHLATRADPTLPFAGGALAPGANQGNVVIPFVTPDGASLYLTRIAGSLVNGTSQIDVSAFSGGSLSAPQLVGGLDPPDAGLDDSSPVVSSDGLTAYWGRIDPSGVPVFSQVYTAHRSTPSAAFDGDGPVSELSSASFLPTWISPNGCRLYLNASGVLYTAAH